MLTTRGVELVGPLPPELQSYIVFTAGVSTNSRAQAAADSPRLARRKASRRGMVEKCNVGAPILT